MHTPVRTISVELTADDARYILHALSEFKKKCHAEISKDEEGDGDLTHMYANDVMHAKIVAEKIENIAMPVFGKEALVVSYELL